MKNIKYALQILSDSGINISDETLEQLEKYIFLIREWTSFASLVSESDSNNLMDTHVVDSLSLAAIIKGFCKQEKEYLDIGTGGGFPAIPIKIVLPELHVTLVERSGRKAGFLQKVEGALGLSDLTVHCGDFPRLGFEMTPNVITARAVEKPRDIIKSILTFMAPESAFLCQSAFSVESLGDMFHVEHIQDIWNELGLRRGELRIITKKGRDLS